MSGTLPALALAGFGLAAGVGITAIGPGGVLVTVGLFLVTGLPATEVAGTAIVTHVATGALGSLAYLHSGQLRDPATRRIALLLVVTAVVGTPAGVLVNFAVPGRLFGVLLAVFLLIVAVLVWFRAGRGTDAGSRLRPPAWSLACLGLGVAVASGMFGVGGPLLTVPLLVVTGTPVLPALAAAQVQSVVIAGLGTAGYLSRGAVDWPLSLVVGIPELCGVLVGWKIARTTQPRYLRRAMITALAVAAVIVALHG